MAKERQPRTKKKDASGQLALKPHLQLIAPVTAIEQQGSFQENIQTTSMTKAQAMKRVRQREEEAIREGSVGDSMTHLATLHAEKDRVALAHSQDLLEETRVRLGLDQERQVILDGLLDTISFDRGFLMFNTLSSTLTGKQYQTLREATGDFPHLTATEIALFPLVERPPLAFFSKLPEGEGTAIVGATPQGLIAASSHFDFPDDTRGIELDPYAYAGITGARQDTELVPFRIDIKESIDSLIPLIFTNNRLHERVWFQAKDTALGIGFGRIAEKAYAECFGSLPERDPRTKSFADAFDRLSHEERAKVDQAQAELERQLVSSNIVDLARDKTLTGEEIIMLIGIIGSVPDALSQETPFDGYIQPYGPGIKIIDEQGKQTGYAPYHPFYLRQAVYGLYDETVDVSKTNMTFRNIFQQLVLQAEGQVLNAGIEDSQNLSEIEEIKIDTKLRFGIDLEVLPRSTLIEVADTGDLLRHGQTKDGFVAILTHKMSPREARDAYRTFELLPHELLSGVKSVRKSVRSNTPLETLLTGMEKEGEFVEESKEIILYNTIEDIPEQLEEVFRVKRVFTLLHEIGESVWPTLTPEDQKQWQDISWSDESGTSNEQFLTFYSQAVGARDDFCDHFAAYVLHADEFRQQAAKYHALDDKYQWIKALFKDKTGKAREYPQVSPFSLEQIHGELEQEIEQMSLEEATTTIEQEARDAFKKVQKEIGKTIFSYEQLTSHPEEDDLENDESEEDEETDDIGELSKRAEYELSGGDEASFEEKMQDMREDIDGVLTSYSNLEYPRKVREAIITCLEDDDTEKLEKIVGRHVEEPDRAFVTGMLSDIYAAFLTGEKPEGA